MTALHRRVLTWDARQSQLRDIQTAATRVADWDRADRALDLRKLAQQRCAREVMLPLMQKAA